MLLSILKMRPEASSRSAARSGIRIRTRGIVRSTHGTHNTVLSVIEINLQFMHTLYPYNLVKLIFIAVPHGQAGTL